jgi:periplasmic protein TonB
MHTRNWIALTLCTAGLAWPCAVAALAGGESADPGRDRGVQATATAAQAEAADTADFKVVEQLPEVVKRVSPKYPKAARKHGDQGTVYVRALVKKDGTTVQVMVPSGRGVTPELDKAAVEAVSQWTFVPARSKGEPVAVWVVIPVKFRLQDK